MGVLSLLTASPAYADGNGQAPAQAANAPAPVVQNMQTVAGKPAALPPLPWNDPKLEDCGQECLYNHANEIISAETDSDTYRLERIKKNVTKGSPQGFYDESQDADDYIRDHLGNFCFPGEVKSTCYTRYLRVQESKFRKAAASLKSNENMIARLQGLETGIPGIQPPKIARFVDPKDPNSKRDPHSTFVAKFKDLIKYYQQLDFKKLQATVDDSYVQMIEAMPLMPQPEDYILSKTVSRDPKKKGSEKLQVFADGTFLYDKKAYARDMKNWLEYRQHVSDELTKLGIDVRKLKAPQVSDPRKVTEANFVDQPERKQDYLDMRADFSRTIGTDMQKKLANPKGRAVASPGTNGPSNNTQYNGEEDFQKLGAPGERQTPTVSMDPAEVDKVADQVDNRIMQAEEAFKQGLATNPWK